MMGLFDGTAMGWKASEAQRPGWTSEHFTAPNAALSVRNCHSPRHPVGICF